MILITKEEKDYLQARFPEELFVRTMKGRGNRGHYYCTERPKIVRILHTLRGYKKPRKGKKDREI